MALRPRAVITTPYPSPSATARVLGVSSKRYRELRAMVTGAQLAEADRSLSDVLPSTPFWLRPCEPRSRSPLTVALPLPSVSLLEIRAAG